MLEYLCIEMDMEKLSFSDEYLDELEARMLSWRNKFVDRFKEKHSLRKPNLETFIHFVDSIKLLGIPRTQSTSGYELVNYVFEFNLERCTSL